MTKKEILRVWLDEPEVRYMSESSICLGYGDGRRWVKDTLRPTLTKNSMFLRALEQSFNAIEMFLKSKSRKEDLQEEDYTLFAIGYKDGVRDAVKAIKERFDNLT